MDLLFMTKEALMPTADTLISTDWDFPITQNFLKKNNYSSQLVSFPEEVRGLHSAAAEQVTKQKIF